MLFLEVPSKVPFPEEVIEGQVNIKTRPLTEFEILVKASGSCFQGLGSDVGDECIGFKVSLGGVEVYPCICLYDMKAGIKTGWEVAGKKQRFKTSAAIPRYTDKSCTEEQKKSQKVNEAEVHVCIYRIDKKNQSARTPKSLNISKEVIKFEKDDRKFFEYASLSFDSGEECGKACEVADHVSEVRELAVLRAVMEQTYISDRRAAYVKRKKELESGGEALIGCEEDLVIDLTADPSDGDSDLEVISSALFTQVLRCRLFCSLTSYKTSKSFLVAGQFGVD